VQNIDLHTTDRVMQTLHVQQSEKLAPDNNGAQADDPIQRCSNITITSSYHDISCSAGARNFHLGTIVHGVWETEVPQWGPGAEHR